MDSCGVINDKSRQQQQLHMYYVVPALVFIFIALRAFSRIKLEIGLGPDDWMIIAVGCTYKVDVGTGLGIVLNGSGQHTYYLSTHQVSEALKVRETITWNQLFFSPSSSSSISASFST